MILCYLLTYRTTLIIQATFFAKQTVHVWKWSVIKDKSYQNKARLCVLVVFHLDSEWNTHTHTPV